MIPTTRPMTLTLATLLLAACASTEHHDSKHNAELSPTQRPQAEPGRILGIGGVFFRSDDGRALQSWYTDNLGLPTDNQGYALLWWRDPYTLELNSTTWGAFKRDSEYFDKDQQYMVNYVVDDLDAARDRLIKAGVRVDERVEDFEYGRFGWFWDPEGIKVELWEPKLWDEKNKR